MTGEMVQIQINRVVKESDKAIQVEVEVARRNGDPYPWNLWLPKSQARVEGSTVSLPEWLAEKKMDEVFYATNTLIVVRYANGDVMR